METFRFYEFFAGVGLARLGLEPNGQCVWANDIDPKKAEIYKANFGQEDFVLGDVSELTASDLPRPVELAWASFPCQDLSLAGWCQGMSAERSGTFWAFWRLMRDLLDIGSRPPVIVLENVMGLLYGDNFSGLGEAMAALGMQFGVLVVDGKWFVPQSRPRVFVVAVDARVDCTELTEVLPGQSPWFPKAVAKAYTSLSPQVKDLWRWWYLPVPKDPPVDVGSLIEDDPDTVSWHSKEETQALLDLMTPVNLQKVNDALQNGSRSVGFLYKRTRQGRQRAEVRFDGIAGCLRTPQGGSSRQTVVLVEDGEVRSRLLSPREAARLMGVPDSFWLPDRYNDAYGAMGDAVVVPLVSWLARHLLQPLITLSVASNEAMEERFDPETDMIMAATRKTAESLAAQWGRTV